MNHAHRSLHDLAGISRQLKIAREQAEALAAAQAEARAARERERNLFTLSIGKISPLRSRNEVSFQEPPPSPLPLQLVIDEQNVLREAMSDEFDVSTLLDVDDQLSFRQPGIGLDVTRKLRAGRLDKDVVNESINATLSRTLLTSMTTLLSVAMLMVFGGGAIFDFALAIFVGVVAGTYASAFIASPVMLAVRPKVSAAPAGK